MNAPPQLVPGGQLVHRCHALLQRPLTEPRLTELVAPQQIGVGEMDWNLSLGRPLRRVFRVLRSAEDAVFRADEVQDELNVTAPVSRVVEDEDGGEGDGREVGVLNDKRSQQSSAAGDGSARTLT